MVAKGVIEAPHRGAHMVGFQQHPYKVRRLHGRVFPAEGHGHHRAKAAQHSDPGLVGHEQARGFMKGLQGMVGKGIDQRLHPLFPGDAAGHVDESPVTPVDPVKGPQGDHVIHECCRPPSKIGAYASLRALLANAPELFFHIEAYRALRDLLPGQLDGATVLQALALGGFQMKRHLVGGPGQLPGEQGLIQAARLPQACNSSNVQA